MTSTEAGSADAGVLNRHPRVTARLAGLAIALTAMLRPTPAIAQEFTFHAETDAAFWVDRPQSTRFTPGFYLALRPGITLGRIVSLQASYGMLLTPPTKDFDELGSAHSLMGGVRLRPLATLRPKSEQLGGLFVDFNLGYVRTGKLDRFGFDVGLGYGFQVAPWLSLGPVVRYGQVVQPDNIPDVDPNDAQFFTAGLNLSFGRAYREEDEEKVLECPPDAVAPATVAPPECVDKAPCADGDMDGVCDDDDRCPTQVGPKATWGCPIDPCGGAPLVVLVQFEYDSAAMPVIRKGDRQTMDPVLDAVADAIAQDPSCRVCIVGHASEEGPPGYNVELSRERAAAVREYMTARGVAQSRLPTVGMGEQCQLVPEATRPLNRRVEFRRLQEGESCPTDCFNE